jgi:hypothetical protein
VIATQTDQTMVNKLGLSAGPGILCQLYSSDFWMVNQPISALITVKTAAAGENAQ